jgi:VIT1/CCC1 family predicted Fe2+/Mn2+ transporter
MPRKSKPHPGEQPNVDSNIREIIFGAEDGFVSTLGLVLGMASATNDGRVVIIAGAVYVIAEAFSMAAGTYLSSKAEKEFYMSELHREKREIKELPDVERAEVRDIYRGKGFRGRILNQIVSRLTSNKELWLRVMMEEELHVLPTKINPIKDGTAMFLASIVSGFVPVLPFILLPPAIAAIGSIFFTLLALFFTGAFKGLYVKENWKRSGAEMLIVGAIAAAIGYGVGLITGSLVH